jgi:hypothetical protein
MGGKFSIHKILNLKKSKRRKSLKCKIHIKCKFQFPQTLSMAVLIGYTLSVSASILQWQSSKVALQSQWPAKLHILTIRDITEKDSNCCLRSLSPWDQCSPPIEE